MFQLKPIFVFLAVSLLIGFLGAGFLHALAWVTDFRTQHPEILYLLPLAGILSVFLYRTFSPASNGGTLLIFESLKKSDATIPGWMAPLVVIGTLLTHLFGGSAGREGTALQMAGSIADYFSGMSKLTESHRKIILRSALAAGFSAVFGTPLAAAVFALEVLLQPRKEWRYLPFTLLGSLIGAATSSLLHPPHSHYPAINLHLDFQNCLYLIILGLICGICARTFTKLLRESHLFFDKYFSDAYAKIAVGGFLIIVLTWLNGSQFYNGLGLEEIKHSFQFASAPSDFLLKMLFTVVTISVGFKGGEVTPLFFIGSTLGSAFAGFFGEPLAVGAAVGFVCVFSGAAKTPLACALMAGELFGWPMFFFAMPLTFLATWVSGRHGIYSEVL